MVCVGLCCSGVGTERGPWALLGKLRPGRSTAEGCTGHLTGSPTMGSSWQPGAWISCQVCELLVIGPSIGQMPSCKADALQGGPPALAQTLRTECMGKALISSPVNYLLHLRCYITSHPLIF